MRCCLRFVEALRQKCFDRHILKQILSPWLFLIGCLLISILRAQTSRLVSTRWCVFFFWYFSHHRFIGYGCLINQCVPIYNTCFNYLSIIVEFLHRFWAESQASHSIFTRYAISTSLFQLDSILTSLSCLRICTFWFCVHLNWRG